jgi:hypothetical protein
MGRQTPVTRGLARRSPWAGIDADTLDELYLSAAATISNLADSGSRHAWQTARDLERAVIAAFRHEALSHWKIVNAQKRRGDRDAVAFDPERDGASRSELELILESDPREELVARDWIVQLHGQVRAFWEPVILDGVDYKQAGDRLGLSKAQRQAMYREGIEHLGRFRALVEEGRVCQLRAPAIAAYRDGTADPVVAERARAHLDCCLSCALTHEPRASALTRGLLGVLPWPAMTRAIARLRDFADSHPSETTGGIGGALLTGKAATVLCAGAVAGGACASQLGLVSSIPVVSHVIGHHAAAQPAHHPTTTPVGPSSSSTTTGSTHDAISVTTPSNAADRTDQATSATSREFGIEGDTFSAAGSDAVTDRAADTEFDTESTGDDTPPEPRTPVASAARSTTAPKPSSPSRSARPTPSSAPEFGGP